MRRIRLATGELVGPEPEGGRKDFLIVVQKDTNEKIGLGEKANASLDAYESCKGTHKNVVEIRTSVGLARRNLASAQSTLDLLVGKFPDHAV